MPIALHPAGRPSQSRQGVGARLVRRLGGAVRSAIVSGLTLAGTRRRPAVSQAGRDHAPAQRPEAAEPSPVPVPPQPRLLARLRTRQHRRSLRRPALLSQGSAPFTPQAYPQLTPKACAVLNTPLEKCDPNTVKLLVSALAQHMSDLMSSGAGMTDPQATLPNLWHRLNTALADTNLDTSLPATPEAVPPTPADAAPDAPAVPTHPLVPAPPTGPTRPPAKDTPRIVPLLLSGRPPSDRPPAAITTAAPQTTPVGHACPPLSSPGRSFRRHTHSSVPRRPFRRRPLFPRGTRDAQQFPPPPSRPCQPAGTGPP